MPQIFQGYGVAFGTTSTGVLINQTSHGFVVGDVLYLNGTTYTKAVASAANTAEVVGIVSRNISTNEFELAATGEVQGLATSSFTEGSIPAVGEAVFLSAITPGKLTISEPTTVGSISLPVGVISARSGSPATSCKMYIDIKRGIVVGATNVRTQISLSNGATSTIQNVSQYEAGLLSGWITITASTSLKFFVEARFSRNGAGTDFNVSFSTSGDIPPAGFLISITSAGLLQCVLPTVAGFGSASITYGLDVSAIGTSFPLSVQSSSIVWSEPVAFRNKIINGNFDIWQRGTSQTSTGYGSDDRWSNENIGSTKTHSRQAFALGQTDVPENPQYFSRTVVSSVAGSGNYVLKHQRIEGVKTFAGQTVTLSFWAKADSSKNICVEYNQVFGSGGSPSLTVSGISPTTCSLTTVWKKFTITTTLPSIAGKTLGTNNDDFLYLAFWFDAGSSWNSRTNSLGQQSGTFDIAQVQLEAGSVATPFEQRPIGTELQLCQRYYCRFIGSFASYFGAAQVANSTQAVGYISFPVTMRVAPSSLETTSTASNYRLSTATTTLATCTSLPVYNAANLTGATVTYTASTLGGTSGFASLISTDGNGFLGFSAEL